MTTFIAQKAVTGFAAFALAAAGTALPGTDANAAPLIFDCYSRSTSDLLMKSALDLSNENLACLQNGTAQVSYQPAGPQTVYVQPAPAPAPAPSTGESFFGSVLGGALGGVIGNAINGGNRTEHHHYNDNNGNRDRNRENNNKAEAKPSRKVTIPGGVTPNFTHPVLRKPVTVVQSPSNPTPNPGGRLGGSGTPGKTNLGGINIPGPGKLGGRLPF